MRKASFPSFSLSLFQRKRRFPLFFVRFRFVGYVSLSYSLVLKKCVCVCDSSFQCCSARVLLPFFHSFDKSSVFFVRWFWRPFFEQVVFALGVLVVTSEAMYRQSLRGTFASSTKYLRQSSRPYACSVSHAVDLQIIRYLSFFDEIFQDVQVTTACCLYCRFFFPSLAKVSLCRKETEDSRGVLLQQLAYTTLFHHTGNH